MTTTTLADLHRQAQEGNLAAATYLPVLAALGAGEPQSWTVAMQRLGRAADLGSAFAQSQLRVLSQKHDPDASWSALAGQLDLGPWLEAATLQTVVDEPRLAEAECFLPHAACRWLVHRARPRLARAKMYNGRGDVVEGAERSNSAFEFAMGDFDIILLLLRAKIAATVGRPVRALEPTQVMHYSPGQAFGLHVDYLDPEAAELAEQMARMGQRIATFLVYLNDGYEGGETEFPQLGLRYRGRAGGGLMFTNVGPSGEGDPRTLHAGLPPSSGEKWLCSQWVRER